jgi:putative ABC transport system permease protein
MDTRRTTNRKMFWRILRRLFSANPGRLFVILLALGSGAAITAALLNLQIDANRRITTEFRAFGANATISPRDAVQGSSTLSESLLKNIPDQDDGQPVPRAAFLYATASVTAFSDGSNNSTRLGSGPVLIAGYRWVGENLAHVVPYSEIDGQNMVILDADTCEIGEKVASQFHLRASGAIEFKVGNKEDSCLISEVWSFGGNEDNQIFVPLETAQQITGLPHQVSLIELNIPGTPDQIQKYISSLQNKFPEADVRPIRQFTEAQAKIYSRISGLLNFTVALVLVLTGLCVMAAMTNVAMERRTDVGLMKAIGGSVRRVLRFFLAEAALLGLAGGILGGAVGIALSIGLGKAVFGVAARPRLIVYPVAVALTILVAIASSYPLRRLASIRPAAVFRGEA